jgi:hypothetical protein
MYTGKVKLSGSIFTVNLTVTPPSVELKQHEFEK